jgi:PAS domain S-box-containing protein
VLAGRQTEFELEYPCHSPSEQRYFLARVTRFADPESVRAVVSHENITQRKLAQDALRQSEQCLKAFLDNGALIAWGKDAQGRHVFLSRNYERRFGVRADDWLGKTDVELFPPDRAAQFQDKDTLVLSANRRIEFVDATLNADGTKCWWWISKFPYQDAAGKPCVGGLGVDITERKQAEEALAASEARYRTLIENIPLRVFLKDCDLRYLSCNRFFSEDTGLSPDALAGKTDFDLQPRSLAEKYRADDRRILASGGTEVLEESCVVTGKERIVQTFKAAVKNSQGKVTGILGAFWDITERKRLEAQRAALDAQLRQQQKLESIGTLASGVAHEINNPINGVMNYAQLILDKAKSGSPEAGYAAEIVHETKRVAAIVRNLLQFSRQEKQSHSPAHPHEIIGQTLSLVRTVMRHDQITLHVEVPAELPKLQCRSQQIQQVVMNLLTNARDTLNEKYAGHHDDKLISISSRLLSKDGRDWIQFVVEDHGAGIPVEIRERVFDPFFTTKPRDKGTGLGLSITHGIVQEHGGRIWFETETGGGTRFYVELPVDGQPNEPA